MPKIVHDTPNCIGCGACAAVCSEFWEMGSDGKSHLKGAEVVKEGNEIVRQELVVEELGCNREAADSCPVKVIKIEE